MATIPTIKVQDGRGGFCVINAKDFDPAVHVAYGDGAGTSQDASAEDKPKTKTTRKPKG